MIDSIQVIGMREKRIAFLASISHKKGPMMMVHAFQAVHAYDAEFTLHLAGNISDPRFAVYLDHIIPELELQDSIQYYGYVNDPLDFLSNCSYILSTSPLEGNPLNILEALSQGLTPLIYNFVGAKDLYPPDFLWKTFPELIEIVKKGPQDPERYKKFVAENYSLDKQLTSIGKIIGNMMEKAKKPRKRPKKSTVSCVIAVKNGQKTIEKAINSLLNQTKPLDKIIVVNDGSTDKTEDIVRKFFDSTTIPIEIITNPVSKWVFLARNGGFKKVDTDYVFFLDSDDWVEPSYVEKTAKILDENSATDVVYPDLVYFDESGNEKVFQVPEFDPQILVQRNFIAYASMQRANAFKDACGYSEYLNDCRNHLTEWDLWLRYIKAGFGFKRLASPLFHYFHSDDEQMSSNYERSRQDMHLQMAIGITGGGRDIQMAGDKKRILLVVQGKDYCDHSQVGFELMTLCKPLEMDGQNEVYMFQYDVEMQYYGRDSMLERLQTFADLVKPTYIFHFSYKDVIPVEMWANLSKVYNTIVFHSDEWRYDAFCKDYEKGFNYAVTTYPSVYEKMEHPGKILSQWAANTYYFYSREKNIEVSFTGQANQNRIELCNGLNVECYGLGWDNGFVSFTDMASVLGRSKISLSFSMGVRGRQLKLRPFEITASKALCICENMPGIEQYFVPEKEIILFDNKKEMDEAIAYFVTHPDKAEVIAQAGYERTMKEHKWEYRLKEIFSSITHPREIMEWEAKGKPVPPPHIIKQRTVQEYAKKYGLRVLVETGTYYGEMVDAMKNVFNRIYSIELGDILYENAKKKFELQNHIEIIHGDSGEELSGVISKIDSPALFWLDGHYSEGVTVKGSVDTPIRKELQCILDAPDKGHVVIIDDARCFGTDPAYPSIDELTELIKSKRPNVDIIVENDSIRVTPQR